MFSFMPMWLFWLILCGFFLITEIFTVSFLMIWPGISAGIVSLLSLTGIPIGAQVSIFAVLTILLLIFMKPLTKKLFKENKEVSTNVDSIIGKIGTVISDIEGDDFAGQIKVAGELYTAICPDDYTIKKGENAKVIGIDGVKLKVEKI